MYISIFDNQLQLKEQDLHVFEGGTCSGKSSLMLMISKECLLQNKQVRYLSNEVSSIFWFSKALLFLGDNVFSPRLKEKFSEDYLCRELLRAHKEGVSVFILDTFPLHEDRTRNIASFKIFKQLAKQLRMTILVVINSSRGGLNPMSAWLISRKSLTEANSYFEFFLAHTTLHQYANFKANFDQNTYVFDSPRPRPMNP